MTFSDLIRSVVGGADPEIVLDEATRYKKEKGVDAPARDVLARLGELVGTKNLIIFSKVNKVGVNPKSVYDTPLGVYGYPFTKTAHQNLVDISDGDTSGKLIKSANVDIEGDRFLDRPYVFVLEVPTKTVHVRRGGSGYSISELEADLKRLMEFPEFISARAKAEAHRTAKAGKPASKGPGSNLFGFFGLGPSAAPSGSFWDAFEKRLAGGEGLISAFKEALLMVYSRDQKYALPTGTIGENPPPFQILWLAARETARRDRVKWNVLLRRLGFDAVFDHGTGVIHAAETSQVLILAPTKASVLGAFENPLRGLEKKQRDFGTDYNKYLLKIVSKALGSVESTNFSRWSSHTAEGSFGMVGYLGTVDMAKFDPTKQVKRLVVIQIRGFKREDKDLGYRVSARAVRYVPEKTSIPQAVRSASRNWPSDSKNADGKATFWHQVSADIPPTKNLTQIGSVVVDLIKQIKDFVAPGLISGFEDAKSDQKNVA